jgi:hypothetical protein
VSSHRRLRCVDLGEHVDCFTLIEGPDGDVSLDRIRIHLRDAHGITPAGFARRRPGLEARLDALVHRSKE